MIHAIAYVVFILLFTAWLGRVLERSYKLAQHWIWILGAVLTGLLGSAAAIVFDGTLGNFLLHASGGISSVLLFVYLSKTLRLNFNWTLTTLFLFGFVSSLGVLNEIAEYTFELLGLAVLSFDTHDTWRDLVANTTGAILAWLAYCAVRKLVSYKTERSRWF